MNTKLCPTCNTTIPANAPGGFCPACILRGADEPAPFARPAPSVAEIAAAFPQLEIEALFGQGGMGFVYKARQPSLDRTVALKILSPELSRDPAFAERFAREARVLGKLNHPNIVTVFESGLSQSSTAVPAVGPVGVPPAAATGETPVVPTGETPVLRQFFYLIMEHVDGVNLRQAMRAGRFTPQQALAIVPGICDALGAAHAQGVWHRDIKPENILLDANGGVKIVDFGIARIVGDPARDFTLTSTGGMLGSAAYMAPEQHEKPHDVDHRADIYSLGVVIYEMLTGELPLGRFPAPSARAAVDARIDEIVFRTLEKERDLRQQSAAEVKTDVTRAANSPQPAPTQAGKPDKLTVRSIALFLGGIVVFLLGVFIYHGGMVATVVSGVNNIANDMGYPATSPNTALTIGTLLIAAGAIAAGFGYLGMWYALWQMKRGFIAPVWRWGLRTFVWGLPTLVVIIPLGSMVIWSVSRSNHPPVEQAVEAANLPPKVVLNILPQGRIELDGKPVTFEELAVKIRGLTEQKRVNTLSITVAKDTEVEHSDKVQALLAKMGVRFKADESRQYYAVPLIPPESVPATPPTSGGKSGAPDTVKISKKLNAIIIPKIEFQNATVREAIELLVKKSKEADAEKEGVNIVLKDEGGADTRITIALTEIPVVEALKYIAALSGMKYRVDPLAVTLHHFAPDEVATKGWKVPPDFLTRISATGGGAMTVRDMLIAAGVQFPPGSIAVYSKTTDTLTVKNSAENLDLIEEIVKAAEKATRLGRAEEAVPMEKAK